MPKQGGQGKGKPKLKDRSFGKALIRTKLNEGSAKVPVQLKSILDNSSLDDYVLSTEMDSREAEVLKVHKNDILLIEPTISPVIQTLSMDRFQHHHLSIPRKPAWSTAMTAEQIDRNEKDAFLQWRRSLASLENNQYSQTNGLRITPYEKNIEVWRQLWRVLERCDIAIQIVDGRNPLLYYTTDLHKYASELSPPKPMLLLINKADFLTSYQRKAWAKYFNRNKIKFIFYSAKIEQERIDNEARLEIDGEQVPHQRPQKRILKDMTLHAEYIMYNDKEHDDQSNGACKEEQEPLSNDEAKLEEGGNKILIKKNGDGSEKVIEAPEPEFVWGERAEEDGDEHEIEDGDHCTSEGEGNDSIDNLSKEGKDSADEFIDHHQNADEDDFDGDDIHNEMAIQVKVLSRFELISLLTILSAKLNVTPQGRHQGRVCVGMLGYPNVGKSSVINTILGVSKSSHGQVRVAISSTPGKTKHFQTLIVNDSLMLCDCPGLVFPSFMRSTAEMLCAGILPINQMRDYIGPATSIVSRVPKLLLEAKYGIKIHRDIDIKDSPNRPPTASEFLCAYCKVKGYITNGTGRWDEFRACKEILRDFNDGKILFVAAPPTDDSSLKNRDILKNEMTRTSIELIDNSTEENFQFWLNETEKTMLQQQEKTADRFALMKLNDLTSHEGDVNIIPTEVPNNSGLDMIFGSGQNVFSQNDSENIQESQLGQALESGYTLDESSDDDIESSINDQSTNTSKRDHKKIKKWGKKNKKLRNKNPYEENGSVSYIVHCTNRTDGRVAPSARREKPKQNYNPEFIRASFPHHQQDTK